MGWGTGSGFYASGWAEGRSGSRPAGLGAVHGADTPAAPLLSKWRRVPRVSLPASVKGGSESSAARRGPQAWLPGLPGLPGFPLPRPRSACLPSPRPAHGPSPPVPGPSHPPLSLPPPAFPPTARSPVPVTLLGVYAWSPPRTPPPPRALGAREPPGARARSPGSLAVADGATAPAGAAETRAQLARGRRAPPPTQPGPDSGPRWPVAPSGPEGEEAGGRREWAPGWGTARPGLLLPREGGRWAAHRSAGGGQDPRAAGRSCPPPPRLRPFLALAKSPQRPEVEPQPPPALCHRTHLSFRLPSPVLPGYLSSPSSLVSTSPHCLRWESYARYKQGRTLRLRGWGLQFPQAFHSPCPWIFSSTEVGAPGIFSGERSHSLEVCGEEGPRTGEDHRTSTPELWLHNWPSDPHPAESPRHLSRADFLFPRQVPRRAKDLGGGGVIIF